MEDPVLHCEGVLGKGGRLSTAIKDFVARPQQIQLAVAIADAIASQTLLVAEAGTGTGKTFAYLVPCLLSGKKTLISTATKTLQDQLVVKDLPLLVNALGLSLRVQNLKGRSNYLCYYRTELHANEGRFISQKCAHDIAHVRSKLSQLKEGERGELPEISEDSEAWVYVTSTADNCLGRECSFYQSCFLMKARKRALDADVVVINHHLYFSDSRLKEEGFGELLPVVDAIIFDEAHQLADIAGDFLGSRFSTRQLRELLDDMLREWPVLDLVNQPLKQFSILLDKLIDGILMAWPFREDRAAWKEGLRDKAFKSAWDALLDFITTWLNAVASVKHDSEPGLARCKVRLVEIHALILAFVSSKLCVIQWIERFKRTLVFHSTPFDVADSFRSMLAQKPCATIFTSATLTLASSFDCFIRSLGLGNPKTLLLPSPFDFKQQALLYLPRDLPDPKDLRYYDALLDKAIPVIEAFGGRCFFLFTSHKALNHVALRLKRQLTYPLLIQGEEAKPILLTRFRALGNAVLLGTATFWEGIDVKGDALSCVIIDKLPFASPMDPVIRGRMAHMNAQGLSGFDELSLPNAVLALKQGVGRLIRDVTDRGVLMIADPRLTGRDYGKLIFQSLPDMRKTRDEQTVLTFIHELALCYESACN